jgi:hypothetical protein
MRCGDCLRDDLPRAPLFPRVASVVCAHATPTGLPCRERPEGTYDLEALELICGDDAAWDREFRATGASGDVGGDPLSTLMSPDAPVAREDLAGQPADGTGATPRPQPVSVHRQAPPTAEEAASPTGGGPASARGFKSRPEPPITPPSATGRARPPTTAPKKTAGRSREVRGSRPRGGDRGAEPKEVDVEDDAIDDWEP